MFYDEESDFILEVVVLGVFVFWHQDYKQMEERVSYS